MNEYLFAFLQLTLKSKAGCRQDFCEVTVFSFMENNESLIKAVNEIGVPLYTYYKLLK